MMKKIFLFSMVVIAINSNGQKFTSGVQLNLVSIQAQGTVDKTTGSGYRPYYEPTSVKAKGINFNGVFGYNPKFYKFNTDLSVGASANIGIGYFFSPKLEGLDGTYVLDLPEYVTVRYGKNATDDANKNIGFAFGAGYDYTLNRIPYRGISIMAEICFKKVSLRFNTNLIKYTYYDFYTSEGEKPEYSVLPMGVTLLVNY